MSTEEVPIKKYDIVLNGKAYGTVEITPFFRIKITVGKFQNLYSVESRFHEVLAHLMASKVLNDLQESEILNLTNKLEAIFEEAKGEIQLAFEENQNPWPESPLKPGEDPLQVLLAPLRRKVIMEPAVETLIYAALSAYTLNPLNVVVLKKKTSEGGTYTLLEVLKIFPPEDIIKLDYATPTSFFHERIEGFVDKVTNKDITEKIEKLKDEIKQLEKEAKKYKDDVDLAKQLEDRKKQLKETMTNAVGIINLWHKIIVFTEPPNAELFAKIKPLLSHDSAYIETAFTDSNSVEGIRTMHVRIQGWPAVFTVFSEDEVSKVKLGVVTDPQLFSRFFKVEINNKPEKFQSVIKYKGLQRAQPHVLNTNFDEQLDKAKKYVYYLRSVLIRITGSYDVEKEEDRSLSVNVFAPLISSNFKAKVGEDMRAFDYLFTLMELRGIVYYDYRLKLRDGKKIKIVLNAEDVANVLNQYGAQILSHLPRTKIAEYEILKDVLKNKALSAEDIFETEKFNYSSPHSLRTHLLSILAKYGYLKTVIDPSDPKHKRLLFALADAPELNLIAPLSRVRSGAIGADPKRFFMKWIDRGASPIAPKSEFYPSISNPDKLTLDDIFNLYIMGQNAVFGAIEQLNMKQSIAPTAPNSTIPGGANSFANATLDGTVKSKLEERFNLLPITNPDGTEGTIYECKVCGKYFNTKEEAEQHECKPA